MQKQEIFLLEGHSSTFLGPKHKSAICDRTPSHLHIKPSLYVCRRVQGSQIFKQNWIISNCSRVIVILLIWVSLAMGQVGGGCLGWSAIVYMSSGMFRGKESSNRIELSQLVQDLLNLGVLGSLQLWGWVDGGGGWLRVVPHTRAHAHACTHTYTCTRTHGKHDNFMQMAAPIGGIPGNSLWCHMHVHACMHVCVHMCGGHPLTTPHPHPPTPPPGDPRNQSKFNSTLTNQDISIPFEDLKSVETSPPMGGCIVRWVGGWFDGWGQVKTLKI